MRTPFRTLSCLALVTMLMAPPVIARADDNASHFQQIHQRMEELQKKLEADRQKMEADRKQMEADHEQARLDHEQMEQLKNQIHAAREEHHEQRHEQWAEHTGNAPVSNTTAGPAVKTQ